jgi:hypothetical protein
MYGIETSARIHKGHMASLVAEEGNDKVGYWEYCMI